MGSGLDIGQNIRAEGTIKSEEKRVEDIDITSVTQNVQCPDLIPIF